jgi:hypothetical protein
MVKMNDNRLLAMCFHSFDFNVKVKAALSQSEANILRLEANHSTALKALSSEYRRKKVTTSEAVVKIHVDRDEVTPLLLLLCFVTWRESSSTSSSLRNWQEDQKIIWQLKQDLTTRSEQVSQFKRFKDRMPFCKHMMNLHGQALGQLSLLSAFGAWRFYVFKARQETQSGASAKEVEKRVELAMQKVKGKKAQQINIIGSLLLKINNTFVAYACIRAWNLATQIAQTQSKLKTLTQQHEADLQHQTKQQNDFLERIQQTSKENLRLQDIQARKARELIIAQEARAQTAALPPSSFPSTSRQDMFRQPEDRLGVASQRSDYDRTFMRPEGFQTRGRTAGVNVYPEAYTMQDFTTTARVTTTTSTSPPAARLVSVLWRATRRRLTSGLVALLTNSPSRSAQGKPFLSMLSELRSSSPPPAGTMPALPPTHNVATTLQFLAQTRELIEGARSPSPSRGGAYSFRPDPVTLDAAATRGRSPRALSPKNAEARISPAYSSTTQDQVELEQTLSQLKVQMDALSLQRARQLSP